MALGCGSTSSPAPTNSVVPPELGYHLPDEIQFSARWIPTDILDLDTSDATFIRAFVESDTISFFAGGAENSYPGFRDAMQPAVSPKLFEVTPRTAYGVVYSRITEMTVLPGDRIRVIGCSDKPAGLPPTPIKNPDKHYGDGITTAFLLIYQRQGVPPPANQQGQKPAPSFSPFGDWYATEYDDLYWHVDKTATIPCYERRTDDPTKSSPGWPKNTPAT